MRGGLARGQSRRARRARYREVIEGLDALLEGEHDEVAMMATVVCELHHAFEDFDWTGFYRVVSPGLLKVGPYQGGHGCLSISFERGVCGRAARSAEVQLVDDVLADPAHIACSASTRSEIVVPVLLADGQVVAVLDVDSDRPGAFDDVDADELGAICRMLGGRLSGSCAMRAPERISR
ncbi:diguanylate cyclase [Lujinxingia litoralis]|uniref:Diguanylate cyclase n=1 Tax=Lujinxingia litoralis TaxID=2211119 RepID=A0A328CBE7_9DELT|nr:GAF domain-containing protein [Lujinxingia litoralis]RAL24880.1 diguanylate cyclase [Lujinxingia litoralis]